VVSGQALTGSNTLVNAQEVLATLKKNQEQIAAMEATIRKLQQELETAKKGAGK
jgi:ABC-type transporter Mla subunit MlaD